jgi:spore coat protein U-like protein
VHPGASKLTHLSRHVPGWRVVIAASGLLALSTGESYAAMNCTVTASGVAFGAYDPVLTSPDDSTGTITVRCVYTGPGGADDTNYSVTLSAGGGLGFAPRKLSAGASTLDYNLYRDAGRTQIWGNGAGGTTIITGNIKVGPGAGNNTRTAVHTVYGRIPAQQDPDSGNYADSILVTLTF